MTVTVYHTGVVSNMTNDDMTRKKQKDMVVIDGVFFYEKNWMLPAPFFVYEKNWMLRYPHHFPTWKNWMLPAPFFL